ncbi:hypothetical protein BGZ96_003903 [Linnemannia gamsii]|uniref:Uncharacterized protein n=1 Tax=Linnemannia gamsii TaxID=64522 RepID=A0ABQ7JIP2_9FUNG|nr:hypothetical protein BGZ96_003903 [Linnemannia gamsii]
MRMKLQAQIESAWPRDDISDGMLLSMYFNPGCAGDELWDRVNAHQVSEHAAEDAAEAAEATKAAIAAAETTAQSVGQDPARSRLNGRAQAQVSPQASDQVDPSDPFQDYTPDQSSSLDLLPAQLPYKRTRPAPTNRLRTETLVYRTIIQRQVDLAIEKRKYDLANNTFNPIGDASEEAVLRLAQVNAEYCVLAYKSLLSNKTRNVAYFDDPLAFLADDGGRG